MAGKVNTKGKTKDDKSKANANKPIITPNEDTDDCDFSLLRKPVHTSITGFGQARKIYDLATEELKHLLSDECDLLYECKVCRNLFRSLANFVSHKRVYCKEKFNNTIHGHFIKSSSTLQELMQIKRIEEGYQESLKENETIVEKMEIDRNDERIPITKDLTTIVEKLAKNKGANEVPDGLQVALQKIPSSNVAVFQSVENGCEDNDNMRSQVKEIENIMSKNVAVLQNDGNFKVQSDSANESDSVIQISDDEDCDTDELKCKKCDMQFSTQKTLKFHMKYKHVESRLVYPCPDCLEIFSTSWSVFRHLFKVHRKTAAQIRRMRESIQAKAFKMNNPPAFYEKKKNNMKAAAILNKVTEEERLDQENQAWMDNMEGDSEVPRCGGCGRTFERRAALAAHTHTCQPRHRALVRRADTKRIEIQIRKDYHKGPAGKPDDPAPEVEPPKVEVEESKPRASVEPAKTEAEPEPVVEKVDAAVDDNSMDSTPSRNGETDDRTSTEVESPEKVDEEKPETKSVTRLPFAQHSEKSNLMALRQRIIGDIELDKLLCKKCGTQHDHIQNLYDHVAAHYKWMRYACKLCNFKHYYFDKLPEHVKVVHKLKGDKDFYFSTVKALDGAEALELSEPPAEEVNETSKDSPDSRRPSRCSSDSSRLSDDSSSSNTRPEPNTRKRKIHSNKGIGKRKRESLTKGKEDADKDENDSSSNIKAFEENSSDLDEVYEKVEKKQLTESNTSVASRRPVRRKTKPKNEDFEYDLSNLLKMEAQGYRDSQSIATKTTQTRKKAQQDNVINYEMLNKECCGALVSLSRKAVELCKAHMRTATLAFATQKEKPSIFVRPLIPKSLSKGDKLSPRKDVTEERKESQSSNNSAINSSNINNDSNTNTSTTSTNTVITSTVSSNNTNKIISNNKQICESKTILQANQSTEESSKSVTKDSTSTPTENKKDTPTNTKNKSITPVVPLKFRRQSLEVMKNPIINKNIKDFTKAGMKTKILVIKPINRCKDGIQPVNAPIKFQTIKLKDSTVNSSGEEKSSDQVVVVKVPKVDRSIARAISESAATPTVADDKSSGTNGILPNNNNELSDKTESVALTPDGHVSSSSKNDDVESAKATSSLGIEDISKDSEVNSIDHVATPITNDKASESKSSLHKVNNSSNLNTSEEHAVSS